LPGIVAEGHLKVIDCAHAPEPGEAVLCDAKDAPFHPALREGTEQEAAVDLKLETRDENGRTIVKVGGEIDVYTAPKLREQLVELVGAGKYHLIVDMEDVDFLDSTGLGVLVGGLKRVRAHEGSLRLVCTQERILKIFRITGLTKVFPISDTVEQAVSAVD
jgi:anti-sigma B factor antagonist